ncbi:S8 family serine peptidase [Myxococcus sp. K15C18031901]|uniref:S8 family serine peptidase n=1 Tax=Myxococcus dinghuensis TaxID=2906761 RepID=UPI0020A80B74|nr:S8 family serine peptidase [Myxococcus dinghuensis]MCP3104013.1 S8 family serine peptidase [Myxococcus dinghuensis]
MKRWVLLGLLGGAVACSSGSDPDPTGPEEEVCPGTEEVSVPRTAQSRSDAAALSQGEDERVIITYRPTVSASAVASADAFSARALSLGARVQRRFERIHALAAHVSPAAKAALAADPDVVRVEEDRVVRALGMPSLSPTLLLGGTPNTRGSVGEYTDGLKLVHAPQVWDANNDGVLDDGAPSGSGIKVCVIDSGWDNRHPELQAAYVGGKDFIDGDNEPLDQKVTNGVVEWGGGHGTHTAATIAAQLGAGGHVRPGEDRDGVVGVAPTVELLVARVLDTSGNGRTSDVVSALEWCRTQNAKVVSLSLGSTDPVQAEKDAFDEAFAAGVLSVAATGNRGVQGVSFPAAYDSVIAVGAVDFQQQWASFSQYGPQVSLVGPGVSVLSATIVGGAPYGDVDAAGTNYTSEPLEYTTLGNYTGKLVYCALGDRVSSCGAGATCGGFVALVDRGGGIYFEDKARNAIRAGAKAIIIGNNEAAEGTGTFTLNGPASYWVPTTSVSMDSANLLKQRVGQDVTVQVAGLDYLRETGTSMATPHVAGVAALAWSACPALTNRQIRDILRTTARDLGPQGKDDKFGDGLVQADAAVSKADSLCPP